MHKIDLPFVRTSKGPTMLPHVRAGVAYIAGRMISGSKSSHVYDYSEGRYHTIGGRVYADSVRIYDYDEGVHIGGSGRRLFHYGEGSHILLRVSGRKFTGFDYGSGSHFSGRVNGKSVSLYDYERGQYFNYRA